MDHKYGYDLNGLSRRISLPPILRYRAALLRLQPPVTRPPSLRIPWPQYLLQKALPMHTMKPSEVSRTFILVRLPIPLRRRLTKRRSTREKSNHLSSSLPKLSLSAKPLHPSHLRRRCPNGFCGHYGSTHTGQCRSCQLAG